MAFEICMPRLGWSMEVGSLVEWYKKEGESVQAGEVLFTVEGDKAIQEVEALESGTLRIPPDSPSPGEEVPVGTVLAYLVQPGAPVPFDAAPSSSPCPRTATAGAGKRTPSKAKPGSPFWGPRSPASRPAISPRARRVAAELGVDWTALKGSGRGGRIVERDVRQAAQAQQTEAQIEASPVARRLAEAAGIDLSAVAAQKLGEKVTREDVEAAVAARRAAVAPLQPVPPAGEAVPVTHVRRIIARRMVESARVTAPLTLATEADATELVALRERIKATVAPRGEVVPTYNDLMVKLTALALQEHPLLNAYWNEDEIIIPASVHIAVAVDTEAGLLVPVIRDVPHKGIQQIAEEARSLAEKAQTRQLGPDDLQGGTFTVTNLGMYGIDTFTPIINLPQCAILGVGRIVGKPAVYDGEVVPRQMMSLSLTFDHRVVDGGPAARFLNTIREYVEQPYLWLVR